MFKGLKHTVACSKCGEVTIACDSYNETDKIISTEKSKCCNANFEYIGLQPYYESVLKVSLVVESNQCKELNCIIEEDEIIEKVIENIENVENVESVKSEISNDDIQNIDNNIKIEDIIVVGNKGVTNTQMIPALKIAIDENSLEKINLLKLNYLDVFESSKKYIGKKYLTKLEELLK